MTENLLEARLRITEIFHSLQGEARTVGIPTVFIRLTGCPLRCHYCDTAYAFHGGEIAGISDILTTLAQYSTPYVTVTGGEPLAQKGCLPLLTALCDRDYRVSLETSGALPIDAVDSRVDIVMDLKAPSSGELDKNCYANIAQLKRQDQVKFVLGDRADYQWCKEQISQHALTTRVDEILLSPTHGSLSPTELAGWILEDQLPVRMQVQLHKYLWNDEPGR